jgi:hypothetical protein
MGDGSKEMGREERKEEKEKCQAQLLSQNFGTAGKDPPEKVSEHWLTVLAWWSLLIGELPGLPGVPLMQVFLHKLPPKERSGV